MNLNEVKKHVVFNLLVCIGIGLCFLFSLIIILATPTKALEQTTDITNQIHTDTTVCSMSGGNGTYCVDGGYSRNVKTTYNGRAQCIGFAFDYYFMSNRDYTLNIIANSNDFRNNNLTYYGYSYTTYPGNAFSVPIQGRFINKQKIQIVFPYDAQETHAISICSNSYMTGDTNYNIKQVYLTYDDGQQDITGVIDNATQNTTDIINNNNSNTESINENIFTNVQSIIKEIANRCNNLISPNLFATVMYAESNGLPVDKSSITTINNVSVENGRIDFTTTAEWWGIANTDYILIDNYTYYLNFDINVSNFMVDVFYYDSNYNYIRYSQWWNKSNISFTPPPNAKYIRIGWSSPLTGTYYISNLRLNLNNGSFCPYGSTTSKLDDIGGVLGGLSGKQDETNDKLDEQNDLQQQQNDYLMDDTNPNVPVSDIEDTLDLVEINNPLGYLLTLPLTLISKINQSLTATCTDFELGHFGFNGSGWSTPLKFPCLQPEQQLGSALWTTIDIIVAVGLLALTVYKIYQAVSNILTLGGEDEVSGSFVYWTPMEFLAIICGGTSVGVFQRRNKQ